MTTTPTPQPPLHSTGTTPGEPIEPPPHRPVSPAVKVLLFVVAPLLVIVLAAAIIAALWPTPVRLEFDAASASRATIAVPDARIELLPSGDGEVHVEVTGWYSGTEPNFTVGTADDETDVRGGCRVFILSRCSLTVAVALPSTADVRIASTNGNITASRMTGALDIGTTNGALRVMDVTGVLSLRVTNGSIEVLGAQSTEVSAVTTNGQVELDFTGPPAEVLARSTNGGITVRVPEGDQYFLDIRTTNGALNREFESDRTAERVIVAETTNGSISVEYRD